MKKIIIAHLLLLLLAAVLVVGIINQTNVTITDDVDLQSVSCGWPFEFVISDQSWRNPSLPWKTNCLDGEWGDNLEIIWIAFVLDIVVIYIGLAIAWKMYSLVSKKNVHVQQ